MKEIFRLHIFPKVIVSDWDVKFTSKFWKGLSQELGTQPNFNVVYHPQIYGQIERVSQVLEYMLGVYVMAKPSK